MKYRIESDTLGEIRLPASVYYGAQTERARQNFAVSGLRPHPNLVWATVLIKKASAQANAKLGVLERQIAEAIVRAADEVLSGRFAEDFVVDPFQAGAGTSHHMNVNEVLANRANEILGSPLGTYERVHPNDHVNFGQSTNDVFPTAMRLALLRSQDKLLEVLDRLAAALDGKGREFRHVVSAGRTHLQDAAPIRVGDQLACYATAVRFGAHRLKGAGERLYELGIGGSAVGTGLNTHPRFREEVVRILARETGYPLRPAADLFWAMNSMGVFVDFSGALREIAVELTRIANDIRLLASGPNTGLGELRLPAVQPGSSIMPGKVNPVMAEMLNMVCFHVIGADTAVSLASQAGQLQLNVMMPVIAFELLFSVDVLTNGIKLFADRCVSGMEVDEDRCRFYFERTLGLATILNQVVGYSAAAKIVQEAQRTGKSIPELAVELGVVSVDKARRIFSPDLLTKPGLVRDILKKGTEEAGLRNGKE